MGQKYFRGGRRFKHSVSYLMPLNSALQPCVRGTVISITSRIQLGVLYINTNQLKPSRPSWATILTFACAGVHSG